jgi:hypothetical protein
MILIGSRRGWPPGDAVVIRATLLAARREALTGGVRWLYGSLVK